MVCQRLTHHRSLFSLSLLDIFLKPFILFPKQVKHVLFCRKMVTLKWKHHIASRCLMSFECLIEPLSLNREGARIVVKFSMDKKQCAT